MIVERLVRAEFRDRAWARWGLAAILFALAAAARLPLREILSHAAYESFPIPLIAAALLCGMAPALVMLALSFPAVWIWLPPASDPADAQGLYGVLYAANTGVAIVITCILRGKWEAGRRLVRQQETLFRELQHRVGNSLQFIAGTLDGARRQIRSVEDADGVLAQASLRVSMTGQLHRRLHDASSYAAGVSPLVREILADLFLGMPVELRIDMDGVALAPSQMTPVVLLVTEAATNALKYAFRSGRTNIFEVTLRRQGREIDLVIADNGPGFQQPPARRGLGMQIMRGLAAQLGGELTIAGKGGTRIEVWFEAPH